MCGCVGLQYVHVFYRGCVLGRGLVRELNPLFMIRNY